MKHGTHDAYSRGKCRCLACVEFRRQARRSWPSEKSRGGVVAATDQRTWPLEPLRQAVHIDLQRFLQVSGDEWARARDEGLSDVRADRWATRVGLHPAMVWGWEWVDAGLVELDRVFINGSPGAEPGWRQAAGYAA